MKPNAHTSRVLGWTEGDDARRTLLVAIAAPPTEGKANAELVRFLAETLGVPRSDVVLEQGTSSRTKRLRVPDGTDLGPLGE